MAIRLLILCQKDYQIMVHLFHIIKDIIIYICIYIYIYIYIYKFFNFIKNIYWNADVIGIGGRLRQLEGLFIGGPVQGGRIGHTISIETLIDVLLVLYDECCNSSLRREKTVSDFIEFGKCLLHIEYGNYSSFKYQYAL